MKAVKVFALAVLMLMVAVPFAGAQTITWNSSFTVVNLGQTDATVTATFYDEAGQGYTPDPLVPGTTPVTNPFVLGPGASQIIVMAFVNSTLPNGRYSVVLSADQPIVAIANLAGLEGTNVNYNGSYSGSEDAGQTMAYLPSVSNAYYDWYSHLSIQNLTNADLEVTVNFYAGTTTPVTSPVVQTVPAYSSWHLNAADVPGLPTSYNGSAVASAAGPIAVVNNDYNQNPAVAGLNQVYSGLLAGSTDLYCPGLYDNFVGVWIASLSIQNVGAADATVNVEYSDGMTDGPFTVGPSAGLLLTYNTGAHPTGYFSAHVMGDQPLVAVANAQGGSSAQTYECATAGATEIRTPLLMKWFIGQYNAAAQVQNIGSAAADVTITYEGGTCTETQNVAAGGVAMFYTPGDGCLPANWSGSATVTSAQPLVGIVNQTNDAPGGNTGDFALSFLMFAVAP